MKQSKADLSARCTRMEIALRGLLDWRGAVNQIGGELLTGITEDHDGIAVALFNGPIWDQAEDAVKP